MRQPGDRAPAPPPLDLVQDLVNTVDIEMERDHLTTVADLRGFCAAHSLKAPRLTKDDVAQIRMLREELRAVAGAHAGEDVPPETLRQLSGRLAAAPLRLVIHSAGDVTIRPAPGVTGASALVAQVASAIIAAQAAGTWSRLKACGSVGCRWAYYDRSPAGRSRWCTMSICGSREKMRRYRARS